MKRPLALTFLTFLLAHGAARDLAAQDLVITNARIIVGNGNVIDQGSLVLRDGRIVAVAQGAANGQGAPTLDAKGMTIMPGFIDAHRHIINGIERQGRGQGRRHRRGQAVESGSWRRSVARRRLTDGDARLIIGAGS